MLIRASSSQPVHQASRTALAAPADRPRGGVIGWLAGVLGGMPSPVRSRVEEAQHLLPGGTRLRALEVELVLMGQVIAGAGPEQGGERHVAGPQGSGELGRLGAERVGVAHAQEGGRVGRGDLLAGGELIDGGEAGPVAGTGVRLQVRAQRGEAGAPDRAHVVQPAVEDHRMQVRGRQRGPEPNGPGQGGVGLDGSQFAGDLGPRRVKMSRCASGAPGTAIGTRRIVTARSIWPNPGGGVTSAFLSKMARVIAAPGCRDVW